MCNSKTWANQKQEAMAKQTPTGANLKHVPIQNRGQTTYPIFKHGKIDSKTLWSVAMQGAFPSLAFVNSAKQGLSFNDYCRHNNPSLQNHFFTGKIVFEWFLKLRKLEQCIFNVVKVISILPLWFFLWDSLSKAWTDNT